MPDTKRAKQIMARIPYATISTITPDGRPWNTPVFAAYDPDFNFYWGSHVDSQHSKNVRSTGLVYLVIYDSTVAPGQGEGVYIEATAEEITDTGEKRRAHALIQARRDPVPYWKLEQVLGDTPIRLYKAIPTSIWMNDEGSADGHYIDIRTAIDLEPD